jgi:hypothetical protein
VTTDGGFRVRRDAAVWREVDGETVILDLASGSYLGLNATGTQLWAALVDGASQADLVTVLVDSFAVDAEQALLDVDRFLETCRARGLVE